MNLKKINYLIVIFSIFTFLSCSKPNNNDVDVIKPKKITITDYNGKVEVQTFEYSGNLITKVTTSTGTIFIPRYENNKIVSYSLQFGSKLDVYTCKYQNNQIVEISNSNSSHKALFYYTGNKVSKIDSTESSFFSTSTYKYDNNGNVSNTTNKNEYTDESIDFIYDNLNHPFKNVYIQIDVNYAWPWFESIYNNITTTNIKSKQTVNGVSFDSTTTFSTTYEYNSNQYPIKSIEKNGSGDIIQTVVYEY